MHPLVLRQLKKLGLDARAAPPVEAWEALLERISQSYAQADQDRYMLERSLEVSSAEMATLYEQLRLAAEEDLAKKSAELEASLSLANAIQEAVAEGIVVCDGERVLRWNRRFAEMWKMPEEVLTQRSLSACVEHASTLVRSPERFRENAIAAASTPSVVDCNDVELLDGSIYARYVAPIAATNGRAQARIICFRDVTEERRIQAKRAVVAERMMAVGQLVASVAHEINNPLCYIKGNVEIVQGELRARANEEDAELMEALEDIRVGVDRVAVIVRDLKTLSRTDEESRSAIDLGKVIDGAVNLTHNHIRHRASVIVDLERLPLVIANDGRLTQVFVNLLVNAADAMPDGRASENEIRIVGRVVNDLVRIELRDTGAGMSAETLERIFDPFFTTKPIGVGTGLGLSICKGILEKLGGTIRVESAVGRGTCFTIELPAMRNNASVATPNVAAPAPITRRRILVVDDDGHVRRVIRRMLARHDVVDASSVEDALKVLAGSSFDVVFCDVMMPDRTGIDMYAELQRTRPEIARRMVFLTGGVFTSSLQDFLDRPEIRRIEKPVSSKQLADAIVAIMDAMQRGGDAASAA